VARTSETSSTEFSETVRYFVDPVRLSSTVGTTTIQSTSTTSSSLSSLVTVVTRTSTRFTTSTTTVDGTVTEHVTETDTVYGYLLVILKQLQVAVGGFVESVNKLGVLVPWLAVIAVVGCIGTVVLVTKKRH